MEVVYAKEPIPTKITKSVFLAGPTPRSNVVPSWRPDALKWLEHYTQQQKNKSLHVFVPEPRNGNWEGTVFENQVDWEEEGLNTADVIIFWIPRKMDTMPALTTNDEWGYWKQTGKTVLGAPKDAFSVRYQQYYAKVFGAPICETLEDTCKTAIQLLGEGGLREKGETHVPLHIWRTVTFQNWYKDLKAAGNVLKWARVQWIWKSYKKSHSNNANDTKKEWFPFIWALHVHVEITAENGRLKTNEVVLSRNDISAVVLYRKGKTIEDTQVVLVKEFRSAVSNTDGYVWELPSGSDFSDQHVDPLDLAVAETVEETGFDIKKERLNKLGSRQLFATFSAHKSHVFSAELTEEEIQFFQKQAANKVSHGVSNDTERTYIQVATLGQLMKNPYVDWSTLGMIFSAIHNLQ